MARFLVTGGCGFIGSHLVESLLADGHGVVVLDDLSSGTRDNVPDQTEIIVGDVRSAESVRGAMRGVDGCFHLAAVASLQQSFEDWPGTSATNLGGTVNVLDAARRLKTGRPVPVVYASSAAVYGDNPDLPLRETASTRPLSAYGADKRACELHGHVAGHLHGVPNVGLRFFNVYGPRQDPSSPYSGVISIFADRLRKHEPLAVFGDGEQTRDFIFVADVVRHLRAAMQRADTSAAVYNVCAGTATSINDLARRMAAIIGNSPDIRHQAARPGDIRASIGDPSRARETLGVSSEVALTDGLCTTLRWLQGTALGGVRLMAAGH